MTELTVFRGRWFLPSNIEKEVLGTLTYDPNKGIQLEIEAPFEDQEEAFERELEKAEIILGESRDGEYITLYTCHRTGTSWGNSYRATWYSKKAFIGCHAFKSSDLYFTEIVLRVEPLFLWLNSSGIQITNWRSPIQSVTFTYTKPEDIFFPIDDKVSGELRFHNNFSFPFSYSESIQFKHSATVAIKTIDDEALEENELWAYIRRFLDWMTVVTGYPCDVEKISFYHKDLIQRELKDGTKIRQEVISYSKKQKVSKKPERPDQFLFDFPELKEYIPCALTRWFSLYKSIEVVIQILAENMGRDVAFSEFHFKDIIQALEAFHRKRIRNERMPKTEYKAIKNRILNQITDEADRLFVKEQLNYGNEPKLRERLMELIDRCNNPSLHSIIGDKETFIKSVIDNRNYYTHLDNNGKKTILTPVELYHLSEKALALLFVTVFNEVIDNNDFISQTLRSSHRWGFRVRESGTIQL